MHTVEHLGSIHVSVLYLYIYLFHTQSIHIDKSSINSNKTIHRINDKYIIMHRYVHHNQGSLKK